MKTCVISPTQLVFKCEPNVSFPHCLVKLHPPAKPHINFTTVSWFSQVKKHIEIGNFNCELQWKRWDQEWKVCIRLKGALLCSEKPSFCVSLTDICLWQNTGNTAKKEIKNTVKKYFENFPDQHPVQLQRF